MTKPLSISEAAAAYGTAVADLQHPIILQQDGQPLAVIISFEEYQQWRMLADDEVLRRQAGWNALETMSRDMHQRTSDYSPAQTMLRLHFRHSAKATPLMAQWMTCAESWKNEKTGLGQQLSAGIQRANSQRSRLASTDL